MDRSRLEDFREQTGSESVPADGSGKKATHERTLALGTNFGCDWRCSESREVGEYVMKLWWLWRKREKELEKEIQHHLRMASTERSERGATFPEAQAGAQREFGNVGLVKEVTRDTWGWRWLENVFEDLRYGVRTLGKNKGFAAVAVLTLALGIGANTAIFSVVNADILRPLPYPDPARLAILWGNVKRVRVERRGASYPDYRDWRDQSRSFEAMAAFDGVQLALTGVPEPERIPCEYVSQPYFSLLGIHA